MGHSTMTQEEFRNLIAGEKQATLFAEKPKRAKRPPRVKGKKTEAGRRTLEHLRKQGWHAAVVEKYVQNVAGKGQQGRFKGGYRKDLWGFIDIIAFRPVAIHVSDAIEPVNMLAVQTTSRVQMTAHLRSYRDVNVYLKRATPAQQAKKRIEHAELRQRILDWIDTPGCVFLLHGWEPVEAETKAGGKKTVWTLTERVVCREDIEPKF